MWVGGAGEGLLGVEDVGEDVLQAFSECVCNLTGKVIYCFSIKLERWVVVLLACLDWEKEYGLNGLWRILLLHFGQGIEECLQIVSFVRLVQAHHVFHLHFVLHLVRSCLVIDDAKLSVHLVDAVDAASYSKR